MKKADLTDWAVEALMSNGGRPLILNVAKYIWEHHRKDLKGSDLFYSWQYDMRWAATELRKKDLLIAAGDDRRGKWTLR